MVDHKYTNSCKCEDLSDKINNKSLNEYAQRTAVAEMIVHKRGAKQFYTVLENSRDECKQRDDLLCLTFDYMQNLQLPKIPIQDLYATFVSFKQSICLKFII